MILFFSISSLVTAAFSLILGFFSFLRNKKSLLNRLWLFVSISIALWSLGLGFEVISKSENMALFWNRVLYLGAIFIPIFYYHFIVVLINIQKKAKIFLFLGYFLSIFFLITNFFGKLFVKGVPPKAGFQYWVEPGPLYYFFFIFFVFYIVNSLLIIITKQKALSGLKRSQAKYVLIAGIIGFGGGVTDFFPQLINTYPFGNFFVALYAFAITYAIAKYRLMDIRFVISKSILYFILVMVVALAFTVITFLTGQFFEGHGEIPTTILVSLIIVLGIDPLKRFLATLTDKFFYKGKIDYQDVLRNIGEIIAGELDLEKLTEKIEKDLHKEVKVKHVHLYLENNSGFTSFDNKEKFSKDDLVLKYILERKEMIITEELVRLKSDLKTEEEKQEIDELQNRLDEKQTGLVVPIISENKIIAVFCIGQKLSGSPFTQEEIDFFEILAPQVATALEKSKLFEEVQAAKLNLEHLVVQRTQDLQERNRYLVALQSLINVITRSLDFQKVMQTIADGISKELGFIGGILNFINPKNNTVSIGAISNTPQTQRVIAFVPKDVRKYEVSLQEQGNLAMQAISKKEIVTGDKMHDFFKPAIPVQLSNKIQEVLGAKSIMAVPVYTEEKVIGVIDFVLAKTADQVTSVEKEMMKSLADQVGIVYRNLMLYQKIQKANIELKDANVRLQQLDKAKSEFLSIASHQLRTPLTGIKGYLSMILEGDFGQVPIKLKNILQDLFQNTDRLTRLVNIFLNVSRIESGRFELEKKDVDLVKLIEDSVAELKVNAERKDLKLTFKKPKKFLSHISLDKDKIKDVLVNLIDNSIKYTPKGKVEIILESAKNLVKVTVQDTGIGINKDEVDNLFKKFVRGEGIAQIHTGGSGLGLYIAKNIIEAHGGKIWAESEGRGKGTAFIFTLPIK